MSDGRVSVCRCKNQVILRSPISLRCDACGGQLISEPLAQELDQLNLEASEGDASRLPAGRIREAAATTLHEAGEKAGAQSPTKGALFTRRWVLASFTAAGGFVAGALAGPLGDLIKYYSGLLEEEERLRLELHSGAILPDQLNLIEHALNSGGDLRELAGTFKASGRDAAAVLADAVADHAEGVSIARADVWLAVLLESSQAPEVERFLRFRRAKALAALGRPAEGLRELDALLDRGKHHPIDRLTYLRQAMNHSYILLSTEDLHDLAAWRSLRRYISEALQVLGLSEEESGDLVARADQASSIHSSLGPGVLIFEAIIRAEESRENSGECLRMLRWHLNLIRRYASIDAVTGWNRLTPLAAQAIRLHQLEFASEVLHEAAQAASAGNSHAMRQREGRGTEWLLHEALSGVLALVSGERASAHATFSRLLDESLASRLGPFLRPISAYTILSHPSSNAAALRDLRIGAMNTWCDTHAAYFPAWNVGLWA